MVSSDVVEVQTVFSDESGKGVAGGIIAIECSAFINVGGCPHLPSE